MVPAATHPPKFILQNAIVSAAALLLMVLVLGGVNIAERVQDIGIPAEPRHSHRRFHCSGS